MITVSNPYFKINMALFGENFDNLSLYNSLLILNILKGIDFMIFNFPIFTFPPFPFLHSNLEFPLDQEFRENNPRYWFLFAHVAPVL